MVCKEQAAKAATSIGYVKRLMDTFSLSEKRSTKSLSATEQEGLVEECLGLCRDILGGQVGDSGDFAVARVALGDHEPLRPAREGGPCEGN